MDDIFAKIAIGSGPEAKQQENHMKPTVFRIASLALLMGVTAACPSLAAAESPADTAQIVDRILQAYGGRAALERVKGVRHSGKIQSYRLGKTGSLTRLFELPGRLRVDLAYPGGPNEQRITTANGAWRDGRPATAPMHAAMQLQSARFRLPLLLTEGATTLRGKADGRLHLEMPLTGTTSLEVFVDPANWRILRSVGQMNFNGMRMAFTADYSDFREVDGVLFAHREDLAAMGMQTGIAILERIEVNPDFAPRDFEP